MGMFWQYFSFPQARWTALFDGSTPRAAKMIVASAVWDHVDADLPDPASDWEGYVDALYAHAPPALVGLIERLCREGFSYEGLSPAEAQKLDSIVSGFFCPEGLEEWLCYKIEHSEGLASRALDELLARSAPKRTGGLFGIGARSLPGFPVTLAPFLRTGRRIGTSAPPSAEDMYFLLAPAEVPAMLKEVEGLLAVDRPWATEEFRAAIESELRPALGGAAGRGDCLAARFS